MEDTEILINCTNHARAVRPLSEAAIAARAASQGVTGQDYAEDLRAAALDRLQAAALRDEVVADLLLVMGLAT